MEKNKFIAIIVCLALALPTIFILAEGNVFAEQKSFWSNIFGKEQKKEVEKDKLLKKKKFERKRTNGVQKGGPEDDLTINEMRMHLDLEVPTTAEPPSTRMLAYHCAEAYEKIEIEEAASSLTPFTELFSMTGETGMARYSCYQVPPNTAFSNAFLLSPRRGGITQLGACLDAPARYDWPRSCFRAQYIHDVIHRAYENLLERGWTWSIMMGEVIELPEYMTNSHEAHLVTLDNSIPYFILGDTGAPEGWRVFRGLAGYDATLEALEFVNTSDGGIIACINQRIGSFADDCR